MFSCSKCGLCCSNIDKVPELESYDSGHGRCIHLTENNLCEIYDNRPVICNVEMMYEEVFCQHMTKEKYYELNKLGCEQLKSKSNKT